MSDLQRASQPSEGSSAAIDDRERTARIEHLLVLGLDHYFAGHHEQAIDVWSRVAFLERRHSRARAYIDRARGALAERQRESEELVDRGRAALDAGDVGGARLLLSQAVARGGDGETASLLLDRLHRVSTDVGSAAASARAGGAVPADAAASSQGWWWTVVASAVCVAGVLVGGRMLAATVAQWPDGVAEGPRHVEPLPVPGLGDLAVQRAKALHRQGRHSEAIAILEGVDIADEARAEADDLRGAWQREILAGLDAAHENRMERQR